MGIAARIQSGGIKVVALFAAATALAGCEELYGTPNVYQVPVARAYQKLMAAPIKASGDGPFHRLEIETTGTRNRLVEWTIRGGGAEPLCVASLKPLEAKPQQAEQTRIDVSCNELGGGAASGMLAKMIRNRVIELVDAALKDRPFDPRKADDGATAAFWPADKIDHGNMGTAAAKALEMDRQMAEDMRQMRSGRN